MGALPLDPLGQSYACQGPRLVTCKHQQSYRPAQFSIQMLFLGPSSLENDGEVPSCISIRACNYLGLRRCGGGCEKHVIFYEAEDELGELDSI